MSHIFMVHLYIFLFNLVCIWVVEYVCHSTHTELSEDSLRESGVSFHLVGPGYKTQIIRLCHIDPLCPESSCQPSSGHLLVVGC